MKLLLSKWKGVKVFIYLGAEVALGDRPLVAAANPVWQEDAC
jgi:hypothetical protein